jgi:hypothetical protein
MNTLLEELKRLEELPIWNETVPLGEPPKPLFVADKLCVEEGQKQPWAIPLAQVGRLLIEAALKNNPFEPLSMKLWLYVLLLNTVVNTANELAGYIVTPDDELFGWVSIPSMRLPLTEGVPPNAMLGSCTITPLLSMERSATGF